MEPVRVRAVLSGARRLDLSQVEIKVVEGVKKLEKYDMTVAAVIDKAYGRVEDDGVVATLYARPGAILTIYVYAAYSGKYGSGAFFIGSVKEGEKREIDIDYGKVHLENIEIIRVYLGSNLPYAAEEERSYWRAKGVKLSRYNDDAIVTSLILKGELPLPINVDEIEKLREEVIAMVKQLDAEALTLVKQYIEENIMRR